jgi:hypothetical protein
MAVNRLNVGATNQLLAKASSGQSTNILELQNTAGVTVAGVDASGNPVGGLAHPPTFKNLIINGAMQVAQRGTSVTGISANAISYNTADRWSMFLDGQGTWTQSVENDAPTGSGFRKSLKMLCTTADASPAAADFVQVRQFLEGQNVQYIAKGTSAAKQLTLSFWVKSNVTGTYIARLFDNDNTRHVAASYTINASGTWEYKTITFPADATGAFDNDNAASFGVMWWLGAGTDRTSGTLQTTWASSVNANSAVGQVNVAAATNNYWQVTGVQLEVGSTATEFEFKPYAQELQECQRYFYMHIDRISDRPIANGTYYSTNDFRTVLQLPVFMRIEPTISASSGTDYFRFYRANAGDSFNSLSVVIASNSTVELTNTTEVSGTGGDAGFIRTNNASTYLGFSAEL